MKIPFKYNLRSLRVRMLGTVMTALGIGLTVAIVVTMMSLVHGLEATFVSTGHDNQLVIIRQGSLNETNSYFNRDVPPMIRDLPGIAQNGKNEPLMSPELVVIINHERMDDESSNLIVRGLNPVGFELRPEVRLLDGRMFRSGVRELMVSRSVSRRFKGFNLGDSVKIARSNWTVVGVIDGGGTAYDSEVWSTYEDIAQEFDRPIYSSILLRAENAAAAQQIASRVKDDRRIQLQAKDQKEYFEEQTSTSIGIRMLGIFIAVVMGVGATFAAMNMMYGTVMSRAKEIATLRALGFRRRSILTCFLLESLIIAVLGGAVGCLLAGLCLVLVNLSPSGTANWMTFSEVIFNFRITPTIVFQGLLFSLMVGLVGGFLPARRASRVKLIEVLRD